MAHVEKISIALTPEMAEIVRRSVETGEYASSSDLISEALLEWHEKRGLPEDRVEELRRLWHEGLASGPGRFETMAAIKAEARRRLMESDN